MSKKQPEGSSHWSEHDIFGNRDNGFFNWDDLQSNQKFPHWKFQVYLCLYPLYIHLIIFSDFKEVLEVLSNIISLPGISTEVLLKDEDTVCRHVFSLGIYFSLSILIVLVLGLLNCQDAWSVKWQCCKLEHQGIKVCVPAVPRTVLIYRSSRSALEHPLVSYEVGTSSFFLQGKVTRSWR